MTTTMAPNETLDRRSAAKIGTIVITRHGEPHADRTVRIDHRAYRDWWADYDRSQLHPNEKAPETLLGLAAKSDVIFASTLPRAMHTAAMLAGGRADWRRGERVRVYQLTRFYRTVGMLLAGGTPVTQALSQVSGLLDQELRQRLDLAARSIREGQPISASLEGQTLTTPVALRMLRVGERTGQMSEMMERIAVFHEEELARWVERFTKVFEPLLMALIGVVIGGIVVLMYFPIFELAGSMR
jgi:hypothetical protein